jgi:hypothetical protein
VNLDDQSTPAGFFATARKACVAACAVAIATAGAAVPGIIADGKVESGECLLALGSVIALAAAAFGAVWRVPNAQ